MKRKTAVEEMRAEYDFSGGARGKYYRRYMESSNVVVLEPDVHKRFKNAAAVNRALRSLIRAKDAPRDQAKQSTKTRTRTARAR